MSNEKILIVEDDQHIAKLVKYNLQKAGFDCTHVVTGEAALEALDRQDIHLILLDLMLPKMDGLDVCRQIRSEKQSVNIPVIMLTAKGEEVDRVVGFEVGADDYIVKPFSPRELVLRVKAILKRGRGAVTTAGAGKDILEMGGLKVDVPRHKVTMNGKEIKLTAMEFKLLLTLMQRKGRLQSRDQLLTDVWELETDVTTRTIDTHIKRLRQKLGNLGDLVETVRGHGYRFHEEE